MPEEQPKREKIYPVPITDEMEKEYLDYAMNPSTRTLKLVIIANAQKADG